LVLEERVVLLPHTQQELVVEILFFPLLLPMVAGVVAQQPKMVLVVGQEAVLVGVTQQAGLVGQGTLLLHLRHRETLVVTMLLHLIMAAVAAVALVQLEATLAHQTVEMAALELHHLYLVLL
jgi:hypothetical protein